MESHEKFQGSLRWFKCFREKFIEKVPVVLEDVQVLERLIETHERAVEVFEDGGSGTSEAVFP